MSDLSAVTSRLTRAAVMTTINVDGRPFRCTTDMAEHCLEVFRGAYDPGPLEFATPPRVLDVGSNFGSFAIWARSRWPGASVHCFEPHPGTYQTLVENVAPELGRSVLCSKAAIRATAGKAFLHFGKNNAGEASFHNLGEQREDGVEVECVAARDLPDCDVLKVDTEGCEREILSTYLHERRKPWPSAVLFEFHSSDDRKAIDNQLAGGLLFNGFYPLVRGTIRSADRGVLAYVRRT